MKTITLNDNEMRRLGALVSYLLMAPRFLVEYAEEYNLPLFRIEQIMLDSEDFELIQKIDNQIFSKYVTSQSYR